MKSFFATVLLYGIAASLLVGKSFADAPLPINWQNTFGGTNTDVFASLQLTSDGGYIVGGTAFSGISGNKTTTNWGDYDFWIFKLNAAGTRVWEADFGGTGSENLIFAEQLSDGNYLAGGSSFSGASGNKTNASYGSADAWLLKLGSDGAKIWERSFGGSGIDSISTARTNNSGEYMLAGSSFSPVSGNKTSALYGLGDAWILKLDAEGNKLWENSFGGTSSDSAQAIEVTDDGGYIFAGSSSSSISGNKTSPQYGGGDYWVVKLDSSGNKQWESSYGGSGAETLTKMVRTTDNGYLLAGHSASGITGVKSSTNYGATDFWIVKIDSSGNKAWDYSFGGSGKEELRALALASDGGYLLGGYSASAISGNKTSTNYGIGDYWLVKVNTNGAKIWEQSFGGSGDDYLFGVQEAQDQSIMIGGYSPSPISGNKTSVQYGISSDLWMIHLAQSQPALNVARSGQQIILSWPSAATGYVPEQNADPTPTGWTIVPGTPTDDGTTKQITPDTGGTRMFFRLTAP